ncbi:MAG: G-D-S-L family lipolytic protein [Chitinophagaceae bacterium]|nr:G-D-S-L family lipolytic protein [Chitinophagaceae bacterium]
MKKSLLFIIGCLAAISLLAQPPFRKEIDAFKKKDSVQMPLPANILFVGSSSFTKWTDVLDYFPGYPILNRGFGGSSLPDLIRYADEIIYPYKPKQIVIYCGENDLAAADSATPVMVLQRFTQLFGMIRAHLPGVPLAFISIKPSPSRWKLEPAIVESNKLIKDFLRGQPHTNFIDVHSAMLKPDGSVMDDIFIADKLHMNAKGYTIWTPLIRQVLLK